MKSSTAKKPGPLTHFSPAQRDSALREHAELTPLASNSDLVDEVVGNTLWRRRLLDAAYQQYCEEVNRGDDVDVDAFCSLFPELEATLRQQIVVHHEITNDPSVVRVLSALLWPQPGSEVLGFRLIERLGTGAFSSVYRAEDTTLGGRPVAVKVCCNGSHEAWILGKLKHENIVPIYSIQRDQDSGLSLICMPYSGRTTLTDVIAAVWSSPRVPEHARALLSAPMQNDAHDTHTSKKNIPRILRRGSFSEGVVFICLKIAQALAHAHSQGVLHLDLKPSNVLLDGHGCPRLLDFNLASDRNRGIPRLGGTLPYMSPEQAECLLDGAVAAPLDEQSDIFSLGVVLHEMLCGKPPYGGTSQTLSSPAAAQELLERQACGPPSSHWERYRVGGNLSSIIDHCLAVDRGQRYESMAELVSDLQRELSLLRQWRRWVKVRQRPAAAAVSAVVLLLSALIAGLACRDPYPMREYKKGIAFLNAEAHQEAIMHLTRSIESGPQQADALFARARAFVATDDYLEALRDLVAADTLERNGGQCALLGYCCNRLRLHPEAASWYDCAVDHGVRTTAVFNNLGLTHYLCGRFGSAIISLSKAVECGGSPEVALRNRAIVHYGAALQKGMAPVDAMRDIESAISLGQCSADTYYRAARIYAYACSFDKRWREKTLQYMERALEDGTPVLHFTSDSFSCPLFEQSPLADEVWTQTADIGEREANRFLSPVQ